MTLSLPSFFAAATRASIPPRSVALVAFAASAFAAPAPAPAGCEPPLLLDEQALAPRASTTAAAAMPVKRRFTVKPPDRWRPGIGRTLPFGKDYGYAKLTAE